MLARWPGYVINTIWSERPSLTYQLFYNASTVHSWKDWVIKKRLKYIWYTLFILKQQRLQYISKIILKKVKVKTLKINLVQMLFRRENAKRTFYIWGKEVCGWVTKENPNSQQNKTQQEPLYFLIQTSFSIKGTNKHWYPICKVFS